MPTISFTGYKSTYWIYVSMETLEETTNCCVVLPISHDGLFLTFFRFATSPLTLSNNVKIQDTGLLQAVSSEAAHENGTKTPTTFLSR